MGSGLNLSERQKMILNYIIKEYIQTAEPVGSRTISRMKEINVSAATIRNEMSDLENLGLLVQPHTSAGRIPADKAYKLYIEEIAPRLRLGNEEKEQILDAFSGHHSDMKSIIESTMKVIAQLTDYTAIGVNHIRPERTIEHISLIPMESLEIIIVVIYDDGSTKDSKIKLNKYIDQQNLAIISQILNSQLKGKKTESIDQEYISYLGTKLTHYVSILDDLLNGLVSSNVSFSELNLMIDGASNIFRHPEFNDINMARSFFYLIENKEELQKILNDSQNDNNNINIIVGDELKNELLKDYAVITAKYEKNNSVLGQFGVIGPKRMDYEKVYSAIYFIQHYMNEL